MKYRQTIEEFPYWILECTPDQREYLIREYIQPKKCLVKDLFNDLNLCQKKQAQK